ncbi:ABC transporter [Moraxella macacae 0408225]|uniref:Pyoverdine export ATP-binding/permease protein PvdT n=1 Tax=Moraxella macacae 0408225 TaxID=1230338 RepID=L2F6X1_9GAMM|nr:MacB family efflux pump subunit [Moraxella macacae]ELA08787.1 ABC transporter [Moraxella macacae 0408225]
MTQQNDTLPILSLRNIKKSFEFGEQSLQILQGISLEIYAGEMVAIVGQSGSGKSTLMNIMACLDKPTSGDYLIDGNLTVQMDSDRLASLRRDKFGFIFQRYQLLSSLNALENVAMPAIYAGMNPSVRQQKAKQLLTKLGLQQRLDHYPNQLSGGQQQRVSIARALMNGGQIIFADEPTGALDSQSSRDVMQILTQLNREGHTIILVTHDPTIAESANRIIKIADGNIISDSTKTISDTIKSTEHQNHLPNQLDKTTNQASNKNYLLQAVNRLKEAFYMAARTMTANKMRTLLTMLGIIIGIASVVLVVALGNGSKQQILKQINSIGAATITISAGNDQEEVQTATPKLTLDDMYALEKQKFVESTAPDLVMSMLAQVGSNSKTVQVDGVGVNHHRLQNVRFIAGGMFNQSDLDSFSQHIVISDKTKKALFPTTDALGQIVILNGVPNRVVGVFAYNGIEGNYDRNLKIWLPYRTYQARFAGQSPDLSSMTVLLKKGYSSALASESITQILTKRHGKKDFTLFNSDSLTKAVEKTAESLTLLISAIAVISLLVGGIGVMNIMLVSVTERTGEIGVRMAVGATYQDIVQQFLIEAMVVCAIGGMIGVLLAFGFGLALGFFNIQVIFSVQSIVIAVACSSVIGLIFGFMPAHRGAKMNPIDALNKG